MALPNDQLFLDRFIAVNKRRFANDPAFVAKLSALTLDKVTFSNFRKVQVSAGVVAHLYDVDSPKLFRGVDQRFMPANYATNGPSELAEPNALIMDDLIRRDVEGIYLLGASKPAAVGAVLVLKGHRTFEKIHGLIKDKCLFVLQDNEINVSEDLTTVTIDSHTIGGVLQVVESLYDEFPRYNGQFRYDGAVRAL